MGNNIFNFGVHLLMFQPLLHSRFNHGIRHRMREVLFQAGSNAKKFIGIFSIKRYDVDDRWLCLGQRSCFVKNNCVCLRHTLKKFSALNCNLM